MDNSKVQTLNDFIRYGNTSSYTVPNCALLYRVENVILLDQLAYQKYDKLLMDLSQIVELTDEEVNRYIYRPDLLSDDIYGTPNLSHLILYLNRTSEYEFTDKKIRLLSAVNLNNVFKFIMSHETTNIEASKKEVMR